VKFEKKQNSSLEGLIWQAIQAYPVDKLEQFVLDPDERVRLTAARRLQIHGGELAYKLSLRLIESKDIDLRRIGIFIIGQLRSTTEDLPERGKSILLKLLKDRSVIIKRDAIVALGHLGDESTIPSILEFANNKNEKTRVAVAITLSRFDKNKIAKRTLKKMANDNSSQVRYWAE